MERGENAGQPFPKQQILDSSKLNSLQTTFSDLMKIVESSVKGRKTLWKKRFQKTFTEDT